MVDETNDRQVGNNRYENPGVTLFPPGQQSTEGKSLTLEAPFPYFGGKSSIAAAVWQRLGDVPNYVEPFFGSGAVLLGRPSWHTGHIETVNDKDGMVSNFWRAIRAAPEQTAYHADWSVNENDLHARHSWLVGQKESLQAKLEGDPDYYDAKIAGWWVWGMSCWIGGGFCSGRGPWVQQDGELVRKSTPQDDGVKRQLLRLSGSQGVNRNLPHLGDAGKGVNRRRPQLKGSQGVNRPTAQIYDWFDALAERLKDVRVCCGDWTRVLGPSPTFQLGLTGVFLDPPYSHKERAKDLYSVDSDVSDKVREWAIEAGENPLMRIALCGYEGEHTMPQTWKVFHWKAEGGYGVQGNGRGRENSGREVVWFSPACLKVEQSQMSF